MGLTRKSTGTASVDQGLAIEKRKETDRVIALAGSPNVGKSTVFNALTGLRQHTGNWSGKTVSNAQGYCRDGEQGYVLVDIPGCYSLEARSAEEKAARDFVCFGHPDGVVAVCDASCLERNLPLVLQLSLVCDHLVVCVNLMDEAKKKKIHLRLPLLEKRLGCPVVGTSARSKEGLDGIYEGLRTVFHDTKKRKEEMVFPVYIEEAVSRVKGLLDKYFGCPGQSKWMALKLLEAVPEKGENQILHWLSSACGRSGREEDDNYYKLCRTLDEIRKQWEEEKIDKGKIRDDIAMAYVARAASLCQGVVSCENPDCRLADRRLDQLFTSRATGFPIMILLLFLIFWLTMSGANYPSKLLSDLLFGLEEPLTAAVKRLGASDFLCGLLIQGMYRVLAWVVSVMLPPMAVFFPLFTLLEDFGYLPRMAFNLDRCFKGCKACGKQALTMAMGFGCNAAGVVGCRIIDSPRERMIAMLTNSFVPRNGRFPTMVAIITMFFAGGIQGGAGGLKSAAILSGVIIFGVAVTLGVSKLLSMTILKGLPSSFTLELPPYRKPQVGRVFIRSVLDRTVFVLGRAAAVAAPAGILIWLMANTWIGGETVLSLCAGFLDPFGRLLGMDGVILMAFILGFPANEIVVPIILMTYMAQGQLTEIPDLNLMKALLVENGWTWVTAVCTLLFSLMHWPCSTTCLTIKKESGSFWWMAAAIGIPTAVGMAICFLVASAGRLFLS